MTKQSIDHQLVSAEVAIEGALGHPGILKRTAEFGYDKKRIMGGQALLNDAKTLHAAKDKKKGAQREASATLKRDQQLAWKTYVRHITLVRVAVDETSGAWKTLQLSGSRKRTYAGWLLQASNFYTELSQDETTLQKSRIAPEEIAQAQAMIEAVRGAHQQHKYSKSEVQASTKASRQSLQTLNAWMKKFLKVAVMAVEGDEQMLEALGLPVKA